MDCCTFIRPYFDQSKNIMLRSVAEHSQRSNCNVIMIHNDATSKL